MQVRMRLYKLHDFDLYSLYNTIGKKAFINLSREIMNAYSQNLNFSFDIIPINDVMKEDKTKNIVAILITFNESKMPETCNVLNTIYDGRRNAFVKHIMKVYLEKEFMQLYSSKIENHVINNTITKKEIQTEPLKLKKKIKKVETKEKIQTSETSEKKENNDINDLADLFSAIKGM